MDSLIKLNLCLAYTCTLIRSFSRQIERLSMLRNSKTISRIRHLWWSDNDPIVNNLKDPTTVYIIRVVSSLIYIYI